MNEVILAGSICLVLALVLSVVFYRLSAARRRFEFDAAWWRDFDPGRYVPVQRLLDEQDIRYLRSLPGYEPRLERELRRHRTHVFRAYMKDIVEDFERLQAVGKLMVMAGASPVLREQLFLHKLAFTRALWRIRIQFVVYRLGLGAVDTRGLLDSLHSAASVLRAASPMPAAA